MGHLKQVHTHRGEK